MRRGWCPTLFEPMQSGDGWLVRVKPPGGRLRPAQARALADAARRHGSGAIELTGRANVQVRGLSVASAARFAAEMVAAGLAHADPPVERRRNVMLAPLAPPALLDVAAALETALADAAFAGLHGKFGFAVGLPGADVCIGFDGGWRVWPDGAALAQPCADPVAAALALARSADGRRMREVAGFVGTLPLPALPLRRIGPIAGGYAVGLPFGATDAATLAQLAACGTLWMTPWRAIVIAPEPSPAAGGDWGARLPGLIHDPSDPRLSLVACPGRPFCASAHAATRADAVRLAGMLPGLAVHLSGCAKGCAHPAPAAVTLVGGADGYALVRHGRAGDPPAHSGLTLDQAAAMLTS